MQPVSDKYAEAPPGVTPDRAPARGRRSRALRPVLWRLHFFSGLLAAPVILSLALTGIAYAWNPQIESLLYGKALNAVSDAPARPLAQQVDAATALYPNYQVSAVVPAAPSASEGEETTAVTMTPPDPETNRFGQPVGVTTVYVDPGSAHVTGQIVEAKRPDEWIRNLHANWRVGQASWLEPLSEMAASWVLVSLLTGLYLFWPRNRRGWGQALRLRPRTSPQARLRVVHTTTGVVLFAALLVMVGTGLTWTRFAGAWVDVAKAAITADAPTLSTALANGGHHQGASSTSAGAGGHGGHGTSAGAGGHGGHGTSAGAGAGSHSGHGASAGAGSAGGLERIDTVAAAALDAGLSRPIKVSPPAKPGHAWTVAAIDNRWPIETATVAVHPGTGAIVDRVTWADQPLLAKATTLGIDFHTAQLFGLANQIVLTLVAAAVIAMIITGYRMWWQRRPAGGLGAPPRAGPLLRTVPIPLLVGFVGLMVLLPMLGVSFLAFLLVSRLAAQLRPTRLTGER